MAMARAYAVFANGGFLINPYYIAEIDNRDGTAVYKANPLQAWNQSAYVLLIHVLLGMQPLAPVRTLIVDPVLPAWLSEIVLRNLRVGDATATIRFTRDADGRAHADILERDGALRLLHQPPVQSLHATVSDRLAALLRSVRHH